MLGEPNRSGSPRVRPQACSSRMLRAGTEGCTTSTFGLTPARPTGASTSSGSKLTGVPSARATSTAAVENISEWPSGGACSTAGTPPPPPRLVTHDATMEASQGILVDQGRGCRVLRDELAGFIGQMDKCAGGRALSPLVAGAWLAPERPHDGNNAWAVNPACTPPSPSGRRARRHAVGRCGRRSWTP
jgi:hypothetical protein